MAYIVRVDDKEFKVELKKEGKDYKVLINGLEKNVGFVAGGERRLSFVVDNKPFDVVFESDGRVTVADQGYSVEIFDEQIQKLIKVGPEKKHKKEVVLKALMPGLIIRVEVKEGEEVVEGQGLLVIEAMKMQNELKAPGKGVVKKIFVKEGQTVNSGDTLVVIE